jgi:hypothetical protein
VEHAHHFVFFRTCARLRYSSEGGALVSRGRSAIVRLIEGGNDLSRRPRRFQKSAKGFLSPVTLYSTIKGGCKLSATLSSRMNKQSRSRRDFLKLTGTAACAGALPPGTLLGLASTRPSFLQPEAGSPDYVVRIGANPVEIAPKTHRLGNYLQRAVPRAVVTL